MSPVVRIDARYERVRHASYPNADAYRMLARCTRPGLEEGWLTYADLDGGRASARVVRNAGVTIRVASIDLGGSVDGLQGSVGALAARLADRTTSC